MKDIKKTKASIPNLQAIPNHICFKNYIEEKIYKEQVRIVNQDVKTFNLSIKFDNPEEIKLSIFGDSSKTHLDNGEELSMELEFSPLFSFKKESADRRYEICVNIINANTNILIPVLILSSNPTINFPREIHLPDTAINTPAYSNIFVLNYSNLPYKFAIETKKDVKVIPECKVIAVKPGDGSSFLIEFVPRTLNNFHEKIYVCFENGSRMAMILRCNALAVNIFFVEESIEFSPTFIGMKDRKSIQIVNNSENAVFYDLVPVENHYTSQNNEEHPSLKYLEIFPKNGELQPQTIKKVDLIFKPEDTNDDEFEILKEISITLGLQLSICQNYKPFINVMGEILGPSFELDHKIININEIFVSEWRNLEVEIKNVGDISGKVCFQKIQSSNDGIMKASWKAEVFEAGESKKFRIKFLGRKIGKFIDQAIFKVKNGERIKFSIQGAIKPLQITVDPSSFQFSSSAICIPQMQFVKLTNELPFDVDINVEIVNNGIDDPLEFLEFYRSNDSISKSPSSESLDSNNNEITTESCSYISTRTSIKNFMERNGKMEQLRDVLATAQDEIVEIFNKVDDYIERKEIVSSIICMLIDDKLNDEIEKREIVETVVELLIENIKECGTADFIKFNEKNWKIPENPRQIECNKDFIKIKSKSSEDMKVFVIPNQVGKFTRHIKLQITMSDSKNQHQIDETIMNIPLMMECLTADIKIHNQTNEISGYVDSEITLTIHVENKSNIDGFFTFPKYHDSQIEVKCVEEKFHMSRKSNKFINLIIIPLVSGHIMTYMSIIALGSNRKFPITIECKSFPPDVVINPKKIFVNDLEVLKKHDTRIFIENRSTTKARFFIKLEHDNQCFTINPCGGILSSEQCTLVMLEKFFYDPGDYRDILIVEIVNGKAIRIPIRCTVKQLPILIEPSFTNVIDFGTLFTTKRTYFLDYKFTNGGKISYMIFIILKNWKNRKEIRFTIEPNRFELSPNCSQMVKFSLNAESALRCEEEFTIEGCSIHFPVRELIWESKLKANVIKPTINFSTNELIFNCYYGQEEEFVESFDITNDSALPLSVVLKIEGDFYIYIYDLNSCSQKVQIDLKSKESQKIFINFDSNLLKKFNKSCKIDGTIKAYSLGKHQSTLKLIAHLIYPEIELSANEVSMIANNRPCSSTFIIKNPSELLTASFELKFKDNSTIITSIHERRQENLLNIVQCLMKQKFNLRENFFMQDPDDNANGCEINDLNNLSNIANDNDEGEKQGRSSINSIENSGETMKDFKLSGREISQIFNSIMTKSMDDEKYEIGIPTTLTSKYEQKECFLSLSQMKGILKPNESRLISIHFSGSRKAFKLSCIINCQVEGGCCHDIYINMINCNPNVLISKTFFHLPNSWQRITTNGISISNINPVKCGVKILVPKNENYAKDLIEGYVKLSSKTKSEFILEDDVPNFIQDIKFSLYPGCLPTFKTEFGIQLNDKPPIPVSFHGKNDMPTATILDIDRKSLYDMNKTFEYECLREMFKIVDSICVPEEIIDSEDVLNAKLKITEEQEMKVRKKSTKKRRNDTKMLTMKPESIDNLSMGDTCDSMPKEFGIFYNDDGRAVWCEKPHRVYSGKMLQMVDEELEEFGFLALDYPNEYPQPCEIINFIAQYGFAKSLESDEIFNSYKNIYDCYVAEKFRHTQKFNRHTEQLCDNSIVVPMPLILLEYTIDFGDIQIDEFYERIVKIYLHNDFTSAAVRSEVLIPSFSAQFVQYSEINDSYNVVNYNNQNFSKYINRHERMLVEPEKTAYAVKRCHSFDFIEGKVHSRKISRAKHDIDQINQIYNEKMSTKNKQNEKNPLTMSEIHQTSNSTRNDPKIVELKITFSPKSENYEECPNFDEIIYIDLHLGPQIPIHIIANMIQPDIPLFVE